MKRNLQHVLSAAAATLLFGGCAHNVTPFEKATASVKDAVPAPSRYRTATSSKAVQNAWIKTFRDPTLTRLVREAEENNPDLYIAASRMERAAAIMRLTRSTMIPQLNLEGTYSYRSWSSAGKHDIGNIVMAISWEPDIWGKISNQTARDRELMLSDMLDYAYARESLAANTAKAWFLLNADKMIYDFNRKVVSIQKEAKKILEARAQIGQGTQRDVHMIRGMLAEAQEQATAAKSALELDTRALEVLIGRYPANAIKAHHLVRTPPHTPASVPASLLNRRPDVLAAQHRVAAAFHNKKAAKLLRLPSIAISPQAGYDILQDTMAKLIGSLFMPVWDAGAIDAQIAAASADQKAAIADYKRIVLRAYREVEDALALEQQLASRYGYVNTMVKEYYESYRMTNENYKIGQGSYIDVLNMQSKWISARIAKVQIAKERLVNRANLYLALGGTYDAQTLRHEREKAKEPK